LLASETSGAGSLSRAENAMCSKWWRRDTLEPVPLAGFTLTNLNDHIKNDLANTEHPDLLAVSFMQNIQFERKPR
jgi:hypothetical protein